MPLSKQKIKLTECQRRFVENMANPAIKTQTEAYSKAYGCNYFTARVNASRLLTNANIQTAIKERKRQCLAHFQLTPEAVLGSAFLQMYSSIDDVLDENGKFDIEKARRTGAIDLIKNIKVESRINETTGETESLLELEMMSSQDARQEVAKYTGLGKK